VVGDGLAIRIDNFSFQPPQSRVPRGGKVTWINGDDVPHLIASADGSSSPSSALDTKRSVHADVRPAGELPLLLHPASADDGNGGGGVRLGGGVAPIFAPGEPRSGSPRAPSPRRLCRKPDFRSTRSSRRSSGMCLRDHPPHRRPGEGVGEESAHRLGGVAAAVSDRGRSRSPPRPCPPGPAAPCSRRSPIRVGPRVRVPQHDEVEATSPHRFGRPHHPGARASTPARGVEGNIGRPGSRNDNAQRRSASSRCRPLERGTQSSPGGSGNQLQTLGDRSLPTVALTAVARRRAA
jgi:hypothetical protein